jgi:hypothetical protein
MSRLSDAQLGGVLLALRDHAVFETGVARAAKDQGETNVAWRAGVRAEAFLDALDILLNAAGLPPSADARPTVMNG